MCSLFDYTPHSVDDDSTVDTLALNEDEKYKQTFDDSMKLDSSLVDDSIESGPSFTECIRPVLTRQCSQTMMEHCWRRRLGALCKRCGIRNEQYLNTFVYIYI